MGTQYLYCRLCFKHYGQRIGAHIPESKVYTDDCPECQGKRKKDYSFCSPTGREYDSDSFIKIMEEIDKLIDERKEMIETIADLQTRAAAHTQEQQPVPNLDLTYRIISSMSKKHGFSAINPNPMMDLVIDTVIETRKTFNLFAEIPQPLIPLMSNGSFTAPQEQQPGPGNQPVIEKGFCDNSGCNNWPECNYQKCQNPPCTSLLSELCAALGFARRHAADALERVRELNSIANRCAQDVYYHQ